MSATRPRTNREGFWGRWSVDGKNYHGSDALPLPVASDKHWKGRREFLRGLKRAEAACRNGRTPGRQVAERAIAHEGQSTCRICGCHNGDAEYVLGGWTWPAGLAHYVEAHNVRPSLAFQEFIVGHDADEDPADVARRVAPRVDALLKSSAPRDQELRRKLQAFVRQISRHLPKS